jgi:hypothetical protein
MKLLGTPSQTHHRGQVLPITALAIIALLGISALVLDVARVYALQRHERSVADAAALAGAQNLQDIGARTVSPSDYTSARANALSLLYRELGGTGGVPSCPLDANSFIVDCQIPNTPYVVSIKTPSPSTMTVNAARAVQVTVRQPSVSMTLSRLFGQSNWNVGITSVAGLDYVSQYAVVTLRGQKFSGPNEQQADDISVQGGTHLVVAHGDVGSNTAVVMGGCGVGSGSGTAVVLDPGFRIDHFDPVVPAGWCTPVPADHHILKPIDDPNYTIPQQNPIPPPSPGPIPVYNTASLGLDSAGCPAAVATAIANGYTVANWPSLGADFPTGLNGDPATGNTKCYKPGIYNDDIKNLSNTLAILLEPGIYWFNNGLTMYGPLIGGYQTGSPGVSLVFQEGYLAGCNGGKCVFSGNSSKLIALNEGTCDASAPVDCLTGAAPARSWDGAAWNGPAVQVTLQGPGGTPIVVPESLVVTRDPACAVAVLEPPGCNDLKNKILVLPGGGNLFVAGVQYAPSDNVSITGSSGGNGRIGQIIAWTLTYNGNSTINEYFPGGAGNGVLRLDTACSGPGTVCFP